MSTVVEMVHRARTETEAVASVQLMTPIARGLSSTNFLRVRVGIVRDSLRTWFATWDQSKQSLPAGSVEILALEDTPYRLRKGDVLVVERVIAGTPETVEGAAVEIVTTITGSRSGAATQPIGSGVGVSVSERAAMDMVARLGGWDRFHRVSLRDDHTEDT